jgi:hypothetical protein
MRTENNKYHPNTESTHFFGPSGLIGFLCLQGLLAGRFNVCPELYPNPLKEFPFVPEEKRTFPSRR